MDQWLKEMQKLARRRVPEVSEAMLEAHREFHFAPFRAAGEGILERRLCILWNTCERYVMNSLPNHERQAAAARENAAPVERIQDRDPEGAVEVLRQHLEASPASALGCLGPSDVTDPALAG
jgi:DNA-binding GntR family transcriptional regulator